MKFPEKLVFYTLILSLISLQIMQIEKTKALTEVFDFLHPLITEVPNDHIKVSNHGQRMGSSGIKKEKVHEETRKRQCGENTDVQKTNCNP